MGSWESLLTRDESRSSRNWSILTVSRALTESNLFCNILSRRNDLQRRRFLMLLHAGMTSDCPN